MREITSSVVMPALRSSPTTTAKPAARVGSAVHRSHSIRAQCRCVRIFIPENRRTATSNGLTPLSSLTELLAHPDRFTTSLAGMRTVIGPPPEYA